MNESPLLDKVRYMLKYVQTSSEDTWEFDDGARVLGEVMKANTLIVNPKGKILGYYLAEEFNCSLFNQVVLEKGAYPEWYNEEVLLKSEDSRVNIRMKESNCIHSREFDKEDIPCEHPEIITTVVPIVGGGKRLGTLVLHRFGEEMTADDLVLAENSATIVGMEMMRNQVDQKEEEMRHKAMAEVAFDSLSYSELEAVEEIFKELNGKEGIIVASKIADNLGITRSVIVNALRKFESAGVIESRSLGMKGTFIKIKHPVYQEEIEKRISREETF